MSERPGKDEYIIEITQIHKYWWTNEPLWEIRPKYKVDVSRRAWKSGKTWHETDYSYTRRGARRTAKKIIKNKKKESFMPMIIERHKLDAD